MKKNWILVSAGFHDYGGQSKANAALADYLVDQDCFVHLIGHDFDDKYINHQNVAIYQIARPFSIDMLGSLLFRIQGYQYIRSIVKSQLDVEIVINGGVCSCSNSVNWVHYVHRAWIPRYLFGNILTSIKYRVASKLFQMFEKISLINSKIIISNSFYTANHIKQIYPATKNRVHNVYLGADPTWCPPSESERIQAICQFQKSKRLICSFVGGFGADERKGFNTLWEAWKILCANSDWDCDLYVAGSGRREAYWRSVISKSEYHDRVHFLGFINHVKDLLAASDLLISPVRYEPYGLNVQEAICRGVPCVVSSASGISEQYPTEYTDLILDDPDNPDQLVSILLKWRSRKNFWKDKFLNLSRTFLQRTWKIMAKEIVDLIEANNH